MNAAADSSPTAADPTLAWKWNDPRPDKIAGVQHGTIESASMKRTVGFNIYLPPAYHAEPDRRFPVVYFLHGSTGTESSDPGFANYVNAEVAGGGIDPMLYVFVNGGSDSLYRDWEKYNVKAETLLIRELIPQIDRDYRTRADANSRAICGFSMGGEGAIRLALKYPQVFVSAGSLGAGPEQTPDGHDGDNSFQWASRLDPAERDRLYLYLVVGNEDYLFPWHGPLTEHFRQLGLRYTYVVHSKVGHDLGAYNDLSARAMIRHLSREFKRHQRAP